MAICVIQDDGPTIEELFALTDSDIMGFNGDEDWGACATCKHLIPDEMSVHCYDCDDRFASSWEPLEDIEV